MNRLDSYSKMCQDCKMCEFAKEEDEEQMPKLYINNPESPVLVIYSDFPSEDFEEHLEMFEMEDDVPCYTTSRRCVGAPTKAIDDCSIYTRALAKGRRVIISVPEGVYQISHKFEDIADIEIYSTHTYANSIVLVIPPQPWSIATRARIATETARVYTAARLK